MPFRLSLLLLFLGGVLVPGAHGQQADTTQLPEIAPQEIQIRGERRIALPSLERQPLTGFARPPKVPTVPPDHRPYVEPYEQELDDLPESLPLPETVAEPIAPASAARQGFVEGGGGRYYSRFFEGRVLVPVSSNEHLSVHGTYTGTEGFTPFQSDSVATPSDVASAQVRFESTRDPVQVTALLHGSAERYTLYGVTPASEQADREGYSVGSSLQLTSRGEIPARAEVRYDRTQYTSHLQVENTGNGADFRQGTLGLSGSVTAPVALRPHLDVAYSRSWLGGAPLEDTDSAFGFDGAGTLSLFRTDSSTVEVGARALAFDTPAQPFAPTTRHVSATFVAPVVNVEWRVAQGVTLHLRNQPRRVEASLHRLYAENPYAMHAPSLRPTLETTNAETGLTLASGPIRFVAAAGYRYAPTYRFFEPGAQGGYSDGVFRVRYGSARILQGRGRIALQGVEGVQASLGASLRDGSLGDGEVIPNFAPITADAMLTVSFAGGNGFFEILGHYKSPRYASRAENNRLASYFTLDLESSYALGSSIVLLAQAKNLAFGAPTLWSGYPRPPAQFSMGLRIRW
ncbi:MAG: hypothetical protein ABEL04_10595 [Salinibacter sp.]|uniref:hypothetical protein n=1 Tax=Salinibacter sp. TaxID=2065818 RepID=UPI0035D47D11